MRVLAVAVAAACSLLAACGEDEPATKVDTLTVAGAWARPTPATATNGVVYLTITSPADDVLVGVSVPPSVADEVGMHETMGGGGASPMPNMPDMTTPGAEMTMAPLDEVALPAGEPIVFEPGGRHIMVTGLTSGLVVGDHFPLTLTLASGASVTADVAVADDPPG